MCVLSNALSLLLSPCISCSIFFFFNDTATTEIYTLSLHDALPISLARGAHQDDPRLRGAAHRIASDISMYLRSEVRSEEHTSELQSQSNLVCRLLLEKKKKNNNVRLYCTLR